MKVLYNTCYGGFGVSQKAIDLFNERRPEAHVEYSFEMEEYRSDPILIDIVNELGEEARRSCSKLAVAEFPDGYDYWIEDYDGVETVHTLVKEDYLRELIRLGNEDDIVNYVMNAG